MGYADRDDVTVGLESADQGEDIWRGIRGWRTIIVGYLEAIRVSCVAKSEICRLNMSLQSQSCGVE
jgi:hypothetical protein